MRDQAAVAAACRRDADRIIVTRDRGQLMREDERDSRIGSQASIYSQRAETDRLGRLFDRDRLADRVRPGEYPARCARAAALSVIARRRGVTGPATLTATAAGLIRGQPSGRSAGRCRTMTPGCSSPPR